MPHADQEVRKSYGASRYAKNPERFRAYMREYRKNNGDRMRAQDRARDHRHDENGLTKSKSQTFKRYGISRADYLSLISVVPGCAICGGQNEGGRKLAVDHDHRTGRVRGLLCTSCNNGLGRFKDSPSLLAKAIKYLTSLEITMKDQGN